MPGDARDFEANRAALLALAYRMLGDLGRAEEVVQEAWIRWQRRDGAIESPRAYLAKVVTRLCLNELESARARKEESRGERLPEPIALAEAGLERVELLDRISMAFLVLLQHLTPAERALLLLHDVFDLEHAEIAALLGKSEAACRQLLKRARAEVAAARRHFDVSRPAHRRLLRAFVAAATNGDLSALSALLSEDVTLIADAGPGRRRYGRVRNLRGPLSGRDKVAAFVAAVAPQGAAGLATRELELTGGPAVLVTRDGSPFAAILIAVDGERIGSIFLHADASRLRRLGQA